LLLRSFWLFLLGVVEFLFFLTAIKHFQPIFGRKSTPPDKRVLLPGNRRGALP
jgi:hypothetical protein